MSEPTNYVGIEPREVDMQPTPPPPPTADFNMLHEQVTWLTRELETLRHENEWIQMELQNACVDIQQARAEAQQAHREAFQGAATVGKDEIKAVDPPHFHKELEGWVVACWLGIACQPSKFTTEGKKVLWAASFLDGPPCSWMQPLINAYLLEIGCMPSSEKD